MEHNKFRLDEAIAVLERTPATLRQLLEGLLVQRKIIVSTKTSIVYSSILVAVILGALGISPSPSKTQPLSTRSVASADAETSGAEIVAGYKDWTRVNPIPDLFASRIALQCAAPTAEQSKMEEGNPHRDKFIVVYVNDIGKHAMMEEKVPAFPLGSVIVKEKLPSKDSSEPELLTAMRKREPGYNPGNGDWEYFALDGSGKSVKARGKLESCQACHMMVKDTDFVSRNYLPYEIWKKLK
jgi:Cytochrome P460